MSNENMSDLRLISLSMRSSTILLLSLRSLAHETIKNLVLAGIGRLIIMDDGKVTEEDLSGGFLFREEEGAVGKLVSFFHLPKEWKRAVKECIADV